MRRSFEAADSDWAGIGERERTQGRAVLLRRDCRAVNGATVGHGSLQKERFGILGEPRGGEAHFLTEIEYQSDDCGVNNILAEKNEER